MALWLLRPREELRFDEESPWNPYFDNHYLMLVRAPTERRARELAQLKGDNEVREEGSPWWSMRGRRTVPAWLSDTYSTCEKVGVFGREAVLLIGTESRDLKKINKKLLGP